MHSPPPPDPRDSALFSSIVLRLPREQKGRYVAAARAQGLTLAAWIFSHLDTAAPSHDPSTESPTQATPAPH